jgi:hypothetical protein
VGTVLQRFRALIGNWEVTIFKPLAWFHLLTHTSGVGDFFNDKYMAPTMSRMSCAMPDAIGRQLWWRVGQLSIFFAILFLWPTTVRAGQESDDYVEFPILQATPHEAAIARVHGWVFQHPLLEQDDGSCLNPANADDAFRLMDPFIWKWIAVVDQLCNLTALQKEKLHLAGRGDQKRLLDRIEKMGSQLRLAEYDADKQVELQKTARHLIYEIVWLSSNTSLFVKTVERVLSPEQLEKFRPLRVALQSGCRIGVDRYSHAGGLEVIVSRTKFTDGDLQRLSELPGIRSLTLAHVPITDTGLAHLHGLANLQCLQLDDLPVTDAGLAQVSRLKIKNLSLRGTKITDEGLRHLGRLESVYQISIDSPIITDAGLAHLSGLTGLRYLSLNHSRVTVDGIAALQRALPTVQINR